MVTQFVLIGLVAVILAVSPLPLPLVLVAAFIFGLFSREAASVVDNIIDHM